jgi:hypothetical protein
MLLPEEAMQRRPSCLAKHRAMDDKRHMRCVDEEALNKDDRYWYGGEASYFYSFN